jgi:hypothetical protein
LAANKPFRRILVNLKNAASRAYSSIVTLPSISVTG